MFRSSLWWFRSFLTLCVCGHVCMCIWECMHVFYICVMWCDGTRGLESSGPEWHEIAKVEKTLLWQRAKLWVYNVSGQSHPHVSLLHLPSPPQPPEGKDTAVEWYTPGKRAYIYGEWLAGWKIIKCDISHKGAVQKSCRVTIKCQHSVNMTTWMVLLEDKVTKLFLHCTEYPDKNWPHHGLRSPVTFHRYACITIVCR